ncbi:MBOAT-domain-containing protein [Pleurostoma richardsiae]|uniref:MBOAT-domain-containing protein n=1 Tax=Pleurostoma richardsiae TaxID=41990 RepID=A0AA38RL50_9PEZI|nr:MBOAT-domain-containing protein [Pleurostoma richardsiae]
MIPYINAPFIYVARQLGTDPDELKLVFSFLLSYPFAGLLKRVPDARPAQKNLFIIGVALFYLVGLFDLWDGLRTLCISAIAAYAIAYFLRGSPYMPWIGFVFLMGHMSVNQLERQFANNPAAVDITGAQMVLVIKLSAFCWNVADGALPDDQLSEFQRDRALRELPSLLDYAGYVFFFPALLAGPACDFAEYRRWLDLTMFDVPSTIDPAKKPPTRRKRKIPRSGTPATLKATAGLLWVGGFLILSSWYYPGSLLEPDYMKYGFLRRVFRLHMVGFTARTKYYGVWSLTEGACILTGLGYNGVDPVTGKVSWNRVQNIKAWGVESAQNTRAYLEHWNIKTNTWLRNYIYLRVTPRGKKPGFRASMATFVTSAFWHGFYPGYYLTFILASFIQTVAKNFRRTLRPFFLDPITQQPTHYKKYYDCFSYLATQLAFSFAVAPFLVLGFGASLIVWARVYFYAIVGVAASIAFFSSPAKAALRKMLEERNFRAGAAKLKRSISTDSLSGQAPVLGLSADPQRDLDEAMEEFKAEVAAIQAGEQAKKEGSKSL